MKQIIWKCGTVQVFGNDSNKSKLLQGEIKRRLNSGNACYQSVQKPLSSRLLSINVKIRIYKTIILPVVLYGCEIWCLTLIGEHLRVTIGELGTTLAVTSSRCTLWRQTEAVWEQGAVEIFGTKRYEVTGGWRTLQDEELHDLYSSPIIIRIIKSRKMRRAGYVARMGKKRNSYQ
jgi:hypothetical protein